MVGFRSVQRVGLLGVTLGGLACGGGGGNGGMGPPGGGDPTCVSGTGGTAVTVSDNMFTPASVSASVNGRVTWTWMGATGHNVTFTGGPQPLPATSCTQVTGTHNVTFTTAGTYNYTCTLHGAMNGSVTVTP
jgi:plastocyanin